MEITEQVTVEHRVSGVTIIDGESVDFTAQIHISNGYGDDEIEYVQVKPMRYHNEVWKQLEAKFIDGKWPMPRAEMEHLWDFVVKYYPNYSSCDEIAHEGDLHKIVTEEDEEGSVARRILKEKYEGMRDGLVKYDLDMARKYIYERAIEGYINSTQI